MYLDILKDTYDYNNIDLENIDIEKQAEELKILVNNLCYTGAESFKSIMIAIYSKIVGLLGSLVLLFKRKILRIFRSLKQTELEEFAYKNSVFLSRLKRANYNDLRTIKVPYPDGLTTTYLDVTNKIVLCLSSFNMVNRSESFRDICTTILNSVRDKQFKKDIPSLQEHITDVDNIKILFGNYIKCYTNKRLPSELPFGDLFLNMQEYISTKELLEKSDVYQFQVSKIYRNIEESNEVIKNCIKIVERDKDVQDSITKEDLLSISNACMFFAKTTDMYGTTIMDFHSLEHNFVETLKDLKRKNVLDK